MEKIGIVFMASIVDDDDKHKMELFLNPSSYNFLLFPNIWEEPKFFIPNKFIQNGEDSE